MSGLHTISRTRSLAVLVWFLAVLVYNRFGPTGFKARLDKFWMHRDGKYDFAADLTGITTDYYMQ